MENKEVDDDVEEDSEVETEEIDYTQHEPPRKKRRHTRGTPKSTFTPWNEVHVLECDNKVESTAQCVQESNGDPLEIDLIEPRDMWKTSFDVDGLPKPPFRQVFNAQSHSGKTNLLLNYLQRTRYGGHFTKIVIWSETILHDPKWEMYSQQDISAKTKFYEGYDEASVEKEYQEQKKIVGDGKQNDKNAKLYIFDDCIGDMFARGGKPKICQHLFMRGRHSNISIIITSQEYMLIPKTIRVNASQVILYEIHNRKEQRTISEEHGNGLKQADFNGLCKQVWSTPFACLMIDYTRPVETRFRKNLNTVMIRPEDTDSDEY